MTDFLTVDLTSGSATQEPLAAEYVALGGHGLTSAIVARDVEPTADPLGPDNVLVIAAGVFAGTAVPNGHRLSVGGKSPLTGGIKEANSGGSAARALARLGLRGVELKGCAAELSVLEIGAGGAKLAPAPELAGLGSYATVDALREKYGDKVSFICIGPAGELQMKAAAVIVTTADHYLRAAARGGLGAVMGSKNLKAIVIDGAGGPGVAVADPAALKEISKQLTDGILSHPAMAALEALGSAFLINVTQSMGCLATKNFSAGTYENAEAITGEHMVELMNARPMADPKHSCMRGCIINCSQVYTDEDGVPITSGLEFETIGLVGSNCLIDDIDQVARIDRLCDDLGLDTMDVGAAMGVAMEAGLLQWGDGQGAHDMLSKLTSGDENARLLASGCAVTGRRWASRASPRSRARASRPTTRACSRAPAPRTPRRPRAPTTPAATPCRAPRTRATTRPRPRARRRSPSSCSATSRPSTLSACACSRRCRHSTSRSSRASWSMPRAP